MEYCVCEGTVDSFFKGVYIDMTVTVKGPDGKVRLSYFKLMDIGKKAFYKPEDAAVLAQSMTER